MNMHDGPAANRPGGPRLPVRVQSALAIAVLIVGAAMLVTYLMANPALQKHYPIAHFSGVVVANGFSAGCATADGLGAVSDSTCPAVAVRVTDSDSQGVPVGSTRTVVGWDHELGETVQSTTPTNPWLGDMAAMAMGGVFMVVGGAGWLSFIRHQRREPLASVD